MAKREAPRGLPRMLLVTGVAFVVNGVIAHLGGGTNWTLSTYGLQVTTPDAFRGRVFASHFALVTLAMTLSLSTAGALSDVWGPGPP